MSAPVDRGSEDAYKEGVKAAEAAAERAADRRHLARLNGAVDRIDGSLKELAEGLDEVKEYNKIQAAVSEAMTAALAEQRAAAITTRTFLLGVGGIIISVAALYLASPS